MTNMAPSLWSIDPSRFSGLRPKAWICVGAGFAREEIKAAILREGYSLTKEAVTTLPDLCSLALEWFSGDVHSRTQNCRNRSPLSSFARQEVLRTLLSDPRISSRMPELKRLRRQALFFRKLDRSIQAGRMVFAHPEEAQVLSERLEQQGMTNFLRAEIQALSVAYEAWLEACGLWDTPMLLRRALETLSTGTCSESVELPEEILYFTVQAPESLEKAFWESLAALIPNRRVEPLEITSAAKTGWSWEKWHSLDDAAESFAGRIAAIGDLSEHAVLIPDFPVVRRSLNRALEARRVPLADPRDPTLLRTEERFKVALLPLEVVASGFERQRVIAWLRNFRFCGDFSEWVAEIHARGIRSGLNSYAGGNLAPVHTLLVELNSVLGGRKTCHQLSRAHIEVLRRKENGILGVFEGIWEDFTSDLERIGQLQKKAPLLFWLERFRLRLIDMSPPVERLRPDAGLKLYRNQQLPFERVPHLWIFGLPASWLNGEGVGDYGWNDRERDLLAFEFDVRSSKRLREERLATLGVWASQAESIVLLDAHYDPDGRERESILPLLRDVGVALNIPGAIPTEPEENGSHPRWISSYGAIRPVQSQAFQLAPFGAREISATALDHFSRCPIQALAYHRWKLKDLREPGADPWPEAKGNILHEAVKLMLSDGFSPQEALDISWKAHPPRGLLQGNRLKASVHAKLLKILNKFCEKEREYIERSSSKVMHLEDLALRLDLDLEQGTVTIIGKPDRIDEVEEGMFLIDYKTASSLPNGGDMVELGYRLQLPFYALAAQRQLGKQALGVQFVELNRRGGRGSGIFFKKLNGKEPGMLTDLRSNSKSLFDCPTEEIWSKVQEHVESAAGAYLKGEFAAKPKKGDQECSICAVQDFCGYRRRLP